MSDGLNIGKDFNIMKFFGNTSIPNENDEVETDAAILGNRATCNGRANLDVSKSMEKLASNYENIGNDNDEKLGKQDKDIASALKNYNNFCLTGHEDMLDTRKDSFLIDPKYCKSADVVVLIAKGKITEEELAKMSEENQVATYRMLSEYLTENEKKSIRHVENFRYGTPENRAACLKAICEHLVARTTNISEKIDKTSESLKNFKSMKPTYTDDKRDKVLLNNGTIIYSNNSPFTDDYEIIVKISDKETVTYKKDGIKYEKNGKCYEYFGKNKPENYNYREIESLRENIFGAAGKSYYGLN